LHTLAQVGEQVAGRQSSWSQNLGHEGVLTTLLTYGTIASAMPREITANQACEG
jgi:hypothetical protein